MLKHFALRQLLLFLLSFYISVIPSAFADSTFPNRPDVQAFIQKMVKKHQFKKQTLVDLFSAVKIHKEVSRQVAKPLEKESWYTYQMVFVNEWRIKHGVEYWEKHANILQKAEKVYGVPAGIIVATIGIETKYGQKNGKYRVLDSLTNLGFSHSPRALFFRSELEEFLLLTREKHLDPLKIMGSYAGAIGQPQFMPSSYRNYAVDFSHNGKIDLMHNDADVIGSIANYYQKHGWATNKPVAVQAYILGDRYDYFVKRYKMTQFMVSELGRFGIVPKYSIEPENLRVKVIELQKRYSKEYWLGFHNFTVIKRYNSSDLYAMAIYQLSSYITALKERQ